MNTESVIEILRSMLTISLVMIMPMVSAAIIVGLIISILQAVTSIQEQTLTFVPKLVAVGGVLVLAAPWMLRQLMEFTIYFFTRLPEMVQ